MRALLCLLLVTVGACSSGDGDAEDAADTSAPEVTEETDGSDEGGPDPTSGEYFDAFAESLASAADGISEADAACFAARFVELVGVSALVDAGVDPEDFVDGTDMESLGVEVADPDEFVAVAAAAIRECLSTLIDTALGGALLPDVDVDLSCVASTPEAHRLESEAIAERLVDGETGSDLDRVAAMIEAAPADCAEAVWMAVSVHQGRVTNEQAACVAPLLDDAYSQELFVADLKASSSELDPDFLVPFIEAGQVCGVNT